MQKHTHTHDFS